MSNKNKYQNYSNTKKLNIYKKTDGNKIQLWIGSANKALFKIFNNEEYFSSQLKVRNKLVAVNTEKMNLGIGLSISKLSLLGVLTIASTHNSTFAASLSKDTKTIDKVLTPVKVISVIDKTASALAIEISEDTNQDGIISSKELSGDIDISIILPKAAVAGDTVTATVGKIRTPIVLSKTHIVAGKVATSFVAAKSGTKLSFSVTHLNKVGTVSAPVSKTILIDTEVLAPLLEITEDSNRDGVISSKELSGEIDISIVLPKDAIAGDTITVTAGKIRTPILLSKVHITAGKVTTSFVAPKSGSKLNISATLSDAASNVSTPVSKEILIDTDTPPSSPLLEISEDANKDGIINAKELNGDIDISIGLPKDAVAGDTVTVTAGETRTPILLSKAHIVARKVTTSFVALKSGTKISISATLRNVAGSESAPISKTVLIDTDVSAPALEITEDANHDGIISSKELSGDIDISIALPKDAVEGDTVTVSAGKVSTPIVLNKAAIAAGKVATRFIAPKSGTKLNISTTLRDAAGNVSAPVSKTVVINTDALAPMVAISEDVNNDGVINSEELINQMDVSVVLPEKIALGDTITVTDGKTVKTIVIKAMDISKGSVATTFVTPKDGETVKVSATLTDKVGNVSKESTDSALIDITKNILTADNIDAISDTTPTFKGTADQPDGSVVIVKNDKGNTLCSATVTSGKWICESTVVLEYGKYYLTAETTDIAGNSTVTQFIATLEMDTDNDGLVNSLDLDDDNDGIPDLVEENGTKDRDTDDDGILDTQDLDSDGDGILDIIEAGGIDTNNDGKVEITTDTDGDGLVDIVDVNPSTEDAPTTAAEALTITHLPITDTDGDGFVDFQDVDSDNDGVSDLIEGGLSPALDSNNDGMLDTLLDTDVDGITDNVDIDSGNKPSTTPDTDNDGKPDYQDLDSDNDGIRDVFEVGGSDVDGDGAIDSQNTLVNGNDLIDSDNDGIVDLLEPNNPNLSASVDANGDGVVDDSTDTDGDGIPDVIDIAPAIYGVLRDTDHDGIPDEMDLDDDNDGIPDLLEQNSAQNGGDTDGDGVFDEKDLDSDGDGISDLQESGLTTNQINFLDDNSDGVIDTTVGKNGFADAIETDDTSNAALDLNNDGTMDSPADTDIDGRPDFQDLDSDNDGIHDLSEGGRLYISKIDNNNDGVIDNIRSDTDGDGIQNAIDMNDLYFGGIANKTVDKDSDGFVDYRDLDSDGDGIPDLIEGGTVDPRTSDLNSDGTLDNPGADSDNDGIPDSGDNNPNEFGDLQHRRLVDTDRDDVPDYQDLDSDNDSILDVIEAGHEDANNDGLMDVGGSCLTEPMDDDGDSIPNFRDVDSDDDGDYDIQSTTNDALDSDTDGVIDDKTDLDKDGWLDIVDGNIGDPDLSDNNQHPDSNVTGSGGATGPFGILLMIMLVIYRKASKFSLFK